MRRVACECSTRPTRGVATQLLVLHSRLAGFDPAEFSGIKDARYDLLPMIQEALAVKREQQDSELRIIASAWTAPPWSG